MIWLYNIVLVLLAPIWAPWMWLRSKQRKEQPNWKERGGTYDLQPHPEGKRVWIHAVSVGEVVASLPILRELRNELPGWEILLSVTTSSGHQTAREQAEGLYDHLVYFPIDIPRFMMAAMLRVKPAAVAIMETELWMNFIYWGETIGAATMLINGRISDRSYQRSMKVRPFYAALLKHLDVALMQSELDEERIKALGQAETEVLGSSKMDQAAEGLDANVARWRSDLGVKEDDFVVVIGSTRGEKDEGIVLDWLKRSGVDAKVIHAPRHLERAPELAKRAGEKFGDVGLRSKGDKSRFLVLDTYGELSEVYSVADVVIIGGGFDDMGGQNLIQPLAHGKPVIHGPHMQNFRQAVEMSQAAGASVEVSTAEEFAEALISLKSDSAKRQKMGAAGAALVQAQLGASKRYAKAIASAAQKALSARQSRV
jgi:3-deoxy-D-manno-octulosonic-acid transferase